MKLDMEAIKERFEKATPGPWEVLGRSLERYPGCAVVAPVGRLLDIDIDDFDYVQQNAHADFIAHARTDIPLLWERVRELEQLFVSLTPGGSEFVDSPENCAAFALGLARAAGKVAKERNELRAELAKLAPPGSSSVAQAQQGNGDERDWRAIAYARSLLLEDAANKARKLRTDLKTAYRTIAEMRQAAAPTSAAQPLDVDQAAYLAETVPEDGRLSRLRGFPIPGAPCLTCGSDKWYVLQETCEGCGKITVRDAPPPKGMRSADPSVESLAPQKEEK